MLADALLCRLLAIGSMTLLANRKKKEVMTA